MAVTTTIIYEYHCDQCGYYDSVRYDIAPKMPNPKPFVLVESTQEMWSPGASFYKNDKGKVICATCKSGM